MRQTAFDVTLPAQRMILGSGAAGRAGEALATLQTGRALVVCSARTARSSLFEDVRSALGTACAGVFSDVVPHCSTIAVTKGTAVAKEARIDALVAIGGGSASDTAKAIALLLAEGGRIEQHASRFTPPDTFVPTPLPSPKLPIIAVPTTASGAEVTPGLGIRDPASGMKLLFWDEKLAARIILLDPEANLDVPAGLMAGTAMNALAHCVEGLYSRLRNPIADALARQGVRILSESVPAMVDAPGEVAHRAAVLTGANLSGMVISHARVGVHHATCHCLGALGGLSHGDANSVMLPFAMAYNLDVAAAELRDVAEAMRLDVAGRTDRDAALAAIEAVRDLQRRARVPGLLRDTGLDRASLPMIAEHTMRDRGLYFNPRQTASAEPILSLLESAW